MDSALTEVLERSRAVGFLGPGPIETHIEHAALFGRALGSAERRFADIGAGGGLPGLPILVAAEAVTAVLIDASQKRCSFLVWAVAELELGDRVEVWCGRAEALGHQTRAREQFDAVVARGFGPPAVTLECAAPLLRPGGQVIISEPPVHRTWPADGLAELGLTQDQAEQGLAMFTRTGSLPDDIPRSTKQLQRRPLFQVK
ncbi:MAG: RsmG family class I SAM-dependent methyltransferase [Actinomycetota bacterium]